MEEDYQYYADNYTFNPEEPHECEDCGDGSARLYNSGGQRLKIGGFSSDLLLCDKCHAERFKRTTAKTVSSDSGQMILAEDVQRILSMAYDRFINEYNSLESRYTDQEVCDYFNISHAELDRCKHTLSYQEATN